MTSVLLQHWEWRVARATAKERQRCRDTNDWETKWDSPDRELIGCVTEMGVCKLLNRYWWPWIGAGNKERGDCVMDDGTRLEIRGRLTSLVERWQQVVSHDEKPDRIYVFGSTEPEASFEWRGDTMHKVIIYGWMLGDDVGQYEMRDLGDKGWPCHLIPVADLESMATWHFK